jgi:hypothetical protein
MKLGKKVFIYSPVGLDLWEHTTPAEGTRVVKCQPYGCPPNGTMGHAFIADAATGEFIGLRLLNSLYDPSTVETGPAR